MQNIDIISEYTGQTPVYPMTMDQLCTMEHTILVPMVTQLSALVNPQGLDKGTAYQQQIGGICKELIVSETMPKSASELVTAMATIVYSY